MERSLPPTESTYLSSQLKRTLATWDEWPRHATNWDCHYSSHVSALHRPVTERQVELLTPLSTHG